jgi:hypothetical protein
MQHIDSPIVLGGGMWCGVHVMNGFEVCYVNNASVALLAGLLNPFMTSNAPVASRFQFGHPRRRVTEQRH